MDFEKFFPISLSHSHYTESTLYNRVIFKCTLGVL